jgi:hypothetical protein
MWTDSSRKGTISLSIVFWVGVGEAGQVLWQENLLVRESSGKAMIGIHQ